jgi:hypothetical protein
VLAVLVACMEFACTIWSLLAPSLNVLTSRTLHGMAGCERPGPSSGDSEGPSRSLLPCHRAVKLQLRWFAKMSDKMHGLSVQFLW